MTWSRLIFTFYVSAALLVAGSRAERVGFQFTGALQVPGTGNVSLFAISVPKTSLVTGTFSYDTATQGIEVRPGVQTYHQTICGGYTLNINGSAIQLAASDYTITVANDDGSPQLDSFSVDYNYDSAAMPPITPEKIAVNDTEWSGTRAYIRNYFSWDPSVFVDSELSADRPLKPNSTTTALVGSTGTPRFFSMTSISAIVPPSGDYNFDGKVDFNDYREWRKAFGGSASYADGNKDGIVDAADYVVWRDALGSNGASASTSVPEPNSLVPAVVGLFALAMTFGRQKC